MVKESLGKPGVSSGVGMYKHGNLCLLLRWIPKDTGLMVKLMLRGKKRL